MSNAIAESNIRKTYRIPKCIISSPADNGNDNNSLSDWAYVVQHEIDLYEEDQDSPDIKNKRQYNAAISALMRLKEAITPVAPKSDIQIAQEYLDGQIELADQARKNCEKHKTVYWVRQYRQQLKEVESARLQLAALQAVIKAPERMSVSCDLGCGRSEFTAAPLPEDWAVLTLREWDLEDSFTEKHICPACALTIALQLPASLFNGTPSTQNAGSEVSDPRPTSTHLST